jgi:glycosyltransferase involved in cell wall biosynthesis
MNARKVVPEHCLQFEEACILHLSCDYPDKLREPTTLAVKRFVDELRNRQNIVVSLNRRSNPFKTYFVYCGHERASEIFAYGYWGLPFGVGLRLSMYLVSRKIEKLVRQRQFTIDLIHSHKLSFEGITALMLSKRLGIPFVSSLRGEVEPKIIRFKPGYRYLISEILERAERLYFVSAWLVDYVAEYFPLNLQKVRLLPNIINTTAPEESSALPLNAFVTVFDFNVYKRKGAKWLFRAFAEAFEANPAVELHVIGTGSAKAISQVHSLVKQCGIQDRVIFLGAMSNIEVLRLIKNYLALALPSVRETFGMVFVEALCSGIPILYTKNTGVDGFLDGLDVGVAVKAGSVSDIVLALQQLHARNKEFRSSVLANQEEIRERFSASKALQMYRNDVDNILNHRICPQPQA